MGRFIGRNIGRAITAITELYATSGIYTLSDQYWHRKQNRWKEPPLSATGGVIYTPGNGYRYHVFSAGPDSFTVTYTGGLTSVELLAVGGGANSTGPYRGGSGGGGVVHATTVPIVQDDVYAISVANTRTSAGAGYDTTFAHPIGTITAKGGGIGGSYPGSGQPGGSGGGEQDSGDGIGTGTQPTLNTPWVPQTGFNQYGNPGGAGRNTGAYHSGGGGGAGESGGQAYPPSTNASGGDGGRGIPVSGFEYPLIGLDPVDNASEANSPTSNHYGGGGGGWGYQLNPNGVPRYRAYGGGGSGAGQSPGSYPASGTNGLGGGGGGTSGNGGSGILVIRYLY